MVRKGRKVMVRCVIVSESDLSVFVHQMESVLQPGLFLHVFRELVSKLLIRPLITNRSLHVI